VTDDRGSVTIWTLGLVLILLGVGGLVLDLWRVLDAKHRVELLADTAAAAGAAVLDEDRYRFDGVVELDEPEAASRARSVLPDGLDGFSISTTPGSIRVLVDERVELSLMELLLPGEEAITVRGVATGSPVLRP
jgi:hypothetical protein